MEQINNMLFDIGVPPHLKGFQYLHDAIKFVAEDRTLLSAMTKRLYPKIAKANNTKDELVERSMRSAIEASSNRCSPELYTKYFRNILKADKPWPTNSEFIATIALFVKKEGGQA